MTSKYGSAILEILFSFMCIALVIFTAFIEPICFGVGLSAIILTEWLSVKTVWILYLTAVVIANAVFMRYGYTYLVSFFTSCIKDKYPDMSEEDSSSRIYYLSFGAEFIVVLSTMVITRVSLLNGWFFKM